jgi:hypothetical protein
VERVLVASIQPAVQLLNPLAEVRQDGIRDINLPGGLPGIGQDPPPISQPFNLPYAHDTADRELRFADMGAAVSVRGAAAFTWLARDGGAGSMGLATTQSPVNFAAIAPNRKVLLNAKAEQLIARYSFPTMRQASPEAMPVDGLRGLDYYGLRNILVDLKDSRAYNDNEKAYIWSRVADAKGSATWFSGHEGGSYKMSIHGSNPNIRDSEGGGMRAQDTPSHSVMSFYDGHHGFGMNEKGEPGMGYMTRAAAYKRIDAYETQSGLRSLFAPNGYNAGDANASKASVDAFHAYRDAPVGHEFEAFANVWIDRMVAR